MISFRQTYQQVGSRLHSFLAFWQELRNDTLQNALSKIFLSVPVRIKVAGIIVLPVLILGFALNYWVRSSLSDWLSITMSPQRVAVAMEAGGRSVTLVTVLGAIASSMLTFVMMLVITQPLLELVQAVHRVAAGDLSARAKVWARDEIGEVAEAVNRMIDELVSGQENLKQANERLLEKEAARQALLSALVRAQEEERARIARELHDDAGQMLTSLLVRLKTLENSVGEKNFADVESLCDTVSQTIKSVRTVSYLLRPAALNLGIEAAVRTLVNEKAGEAGINAEFTSNVGKERFRFEIETTLYRIAQEAMTNVIRHAQATYVEVELVKLPYALGLRIADNGVGFETAHPANNKERQHLGLEGMRERVEMLGGSLVITSAPAAGTIVEVRAPLPLENMG